MIYGYVSGAIYKEGIGDIDFIYGKSGDKGYGLAHINTRDYPARCCL